MINLHKSTEYQVQIYCDLMVAVHWYISDGMYHDNVYDHCCKMFLWSIGKSSTLSLVIALAN